MTASLDHIHPETPMGANLIADGATFRVWAPHAHSVHVIGDFNNHERTDASLLNRDNVGAFGAGWTFTYDITAYVNASGDVFIRSPSGPPFSRLAAQRNQSGSKSCPSSIRTASYFSDSAKCPAPPSRAAAARDS